MVARLPSNEGESAQILLEASAHQAKGWDFFPNRLEQLPQPVKIPEGPSTPPGTLKRIPRLMELEELALFRKFVPCLAGAPLTLYAQKRKWLLSYEKHHKREKLCAYFPPLKVVAC